MGIFWAILDLQRKKIKLNNSNVKFALKTNPKKSKYIHIFAVFPSQIHQKACFYKEFNERIFAPMN